METCPIKYLLTAFLVSACCVVAPTAAERAYYDEIPAAPADFTAPNVAARTVDGLGFRYFWATEGLTEKNLLYRPNEDARTLGETIDHLYNLALVVAQATAGETTHFPIDLSGMSFAEKRETTLANIKRASDRLRVADVGDLDTFQLEFKFPDGGGRKLPFWNALNGPIADALWHCGQVVSFRRSAGNPFNSNASVLTGTVRE